ncbi:MAG TPA: TRAP transporter substrate-binding protein DctP [candidate division Zixibacteria bacterium]|nr:TRAP transporter substrate-binding protein DctP [candidate division Zixibacteria bacterium]
MLLGAWPAPSRAQAQATLRLSFPEVAEAVQCARILAAAKDGPYRIEPEGEGVPELTLKLNFPELTLIFLGFFNYRSSEDVLQAIQLPFVFRDLGHFQAFARSALLEAEAEKAEGIRPLALIYAGTSYMMGKRPLTSADDLKRASKAFFHPAFDGRPENTERYSRFVSRVKSEIEDAASVTPIQAVRAGLAEVVPYLTRVDIQRYFMALAVNADMWSGMSPDRRQALSAWAKRMADRCSARNFDAETRAIEVLKKQGVRIVEPDESFRSFWPHWPDPSNGISSEEAKAFIRKIQAIP